MKSIMYPKRLMRLDDTQKLNREKIDGWRKGRKRFVRFVGVFSSS